MITVMLENVSPDDLYVTVIDANRQDNPTVFDARINAGRIEPVDVQEDDDDYANLTWTASRPGGLPTSRDAQPGPGDTVEIEL